MNVKSNKKVGKKNAILRKIRSAYRLIFRLPPPWETKQLFDRTYKLREGTIRDIADYDDGWVFSCSQLARRIFDIGANIGQSAMLELFSGKVAHVLLVDPNPMALAIAAENLIMNHLVSRVNFECVFIGDQPEEEVEFYTALSGAAGSMFSSHAKTAAKNNSHYKVPTTTIDLLCDRYSVPDLIKMDIEGAESLALEGSRRCMEFQKTRFLVEMHSNPDLSMIENSSKVLNICSRVGYKAWYLSNQIPLERPEQIKNRGRCHLLLQPHDWPWPETVIHIPQNAIFDQELFNSIISSNKLEFRNAK